MEYLQYISPELLILVPVLYGIGAIIKNLETVKDNYIPAILCVTGIVLSCLWVLGTEGVNCTSLFTAIVQGVLVAAAAVFSNQLVKQAAK